MTKDHAFYYRIERNPAGEPVQLSWIRPGYLNGYLKAALIKLHAKKRPSLENKIKWLIRNMG